MNDSLICDGTYSGGERETGRKKRGKSERLRRREKREHERETDIHTHMNMIWHGRHDIFTATAYSCVT